MCRVDHDITVPAWATVRTTGAPAQGFVQVLMDEARSVPPEIRHLRAGASWRRIVAHFLPQLPPVEITKHLPDQNNIQKQQQQQQQQQQEVIKCGMLCIWCGWGATPPCVWMDGRSVDRLMPACLPACLNTYGEIGSLPCRVVRVANGVAGVHMHLTEPVVVARVLVKRRTPKLGRIVRAVCNGWGQHHNVRPPKRRVPIDFVPERVRAHAYMCARMCTCTHTRTHEHQQRRGEEDESTNVVLAGCLCSCSCVYMSW